MKDQAGDATRIDKKIVAPDLKPLSPSESEARAFFQRLIFSIRNFEAALGADHELYVTMPSAPGVRIYDINKNSEAFYFSGEDIEGRSANGNSTLHTGHRDARRYPPIKRGSAATDRIFGGVFLAFDPGVDQLPAIFLSREPVAHGREFGLGEGHSATASLSRNLDEEPVVRPPKCRPTLWLDLDEVGFGASGNLARASFTRSLMAPIPTKS